MKDVHLWDRPRLSVLERQGWQPPRLQILRIDGKGMIDDVIMHGILHHLWKKKREKDVVGMVTFDLTGFLPINHIIAYITMVYRRLWGNVRCYQYNISLNKLCKIFEISLTESQTYKKWQTLAIIREISDSLSGDWEKQFKIWSLPDYPGELTALERCLT